MTIATESYAAIHENYTKALAWMDQIGVAMGPTRLKHYDKVVGHWKARYEQASEDEGKDIFPDFVSSMFEIHDFVDVYLAFKDVDKAELGAIAEKLQKGVSGPINAVEETHKSTTARNYLFEVATAARAHRPHAGVQAILNARSDTGFLLEGYKVWVECKRITSENKIYDNVRKASKQLETALGRQPGSCQRGVVALEVSKIFTPGDEIFVKGTERELLGAVNEIMDRFIGQYSNEWEKVYERRSKKVIGTLIRFSFMSSVEERNLLVHTAQWGVNPRRGLSEADSVVLKKLAARLEGAK